MHSHPGPAVSEHGDGGDLDVDQFAPGLESLLNITPLVWGITIVITIAFFVYEFFAHVRKPHEPSIGEAARWSAFYIGLALVFGVGIGFVSGWDYGGEYFAG